MHLIEGSTGDAHLPAYHARVSIGIDALLRDLVARDASDLHLKAGKPPVMRIRGDLVRAHEHAMTVDEHNKLLFGILNEERRERLETSKEVDLSYHVAGCARFRVNMFWQRGMIGAVLARYSAIRVRTVCSLSSGRRLNSCPPHESQVPATAGTWKLS